MIKIGSPKCYIYDIIMLYTYKGGYLVNVSEAIKGIRRKCLLSQTEFADHIGVSFSTVNRWENGRTVPNYQTLKKIKHFCEINNIVFNIDDLL